MSRILTKLEEAAIEIYSLFMQGRILVLDNESSIVFIRFLEEAKKIPGAQKKILMAMQLGKGKS